jgi:hypothetical protein
LFGIPVASVVIATCETSTMSHLVIVDRHPVIAMGPCVLAATIVLLVLAVSISV